MNSAWIMMGALALAMLIDRVWGEPPARVHPVVAMGFYLSFCGRFVTRGSSGWAFTLGALAWMLGAGILGGLAWVAQVQLVKHANPWLAAVLLALLLKPMMAWRMLYSEVAAVEAALQQSLDAGRERLGWLVSRDTSQLSADEVRESAIESLAENLNDSVVAPIFWFVLFGLPGAVVYRFANTADAMWGYRGMRNGVCWEWAGKWAAWADDVLSWVPARITALLLALVAGGMNLKTLWLEARKTPSPNSGWPMAAMALALGIRLSKPGVYRLNPQGRVPAPQDVVVAQRHASKVTLALWIWAQLAIVLIASVWV